MRPLARTDQPQWRGGLLPAQLGGLLDPAIERIQGVMRPENWNLTQWPSLEQIQASAQAKGPVGWDQMAPLMDAVNPMAKLGGLFAHTVWHGSPHKWDVPDISKVGTGEGSQAYGYGFYSAEAPETAKYYRDALKDYKSRYRDRFDGEDKGTLIANKLLDEFHGDTQIAVAAARDRANYAVSDEFKDAYLAAQNLLSQINVDSSAYLYKLDIPDEDIPKYLDWDKPLSEQPDVVRGALQPIKEYLLGKPITDQAKNRIISDEMSGADFYRMLQAELSLDHGVNVTKAQDIVSEALNIEGIPGIRYLDGSSRGAGEGTYNYVTFDPSRIKVLERK